MIELKNLSFGYSRKKVVLDKINLCFTPGNIHGLLGKNGEGKSTLLKIISGQLFPDSGTCQVLNEQPVQRKVSFLRSFYLISEDIYLPDLSVKMYFKTYAPFYPSFDKLILQKCMEAFEIKETESIRKMSLGQKKKVAISMALAANTPLLLMDEPTNGLDIPSKSVFRKLVASVMNDNRTIIISTHQVRDLENLIDAVIILDKQQVVFQQSLCEISRKLTFRVLQQTEQPLFCESTPSGTIGVIENKNQENTDVDLELLFNATIGHTDEIKRIFGSY